MPAPKSAENLRSLSAALSIETPPASICSTTCTAHVSIRQHTSAYVSIRPHSPLTRPPPASICSTA